MWKICPLRHQHIRKNSWWLTKLRGVGEHWWRGAANHFIYIFISSKNKHIISMSLLNCEPCLFSGPTCFEPCALPCLTCLFPYMLSYLTCLVSYVLLCLKCIIPYMLLCLTCIVAYVLSCFTRLIPYIL